VSQRTDRVDELLRQEIGALIAKDLADPRIGFVTITDVETSPDLRHARVWVSVIGTRAEVEASLRSLEQAVGFIRRELGHRLRIRRIPELHLRLDDSAERGTRVLKLLEELEAGVAPDELPPVTESLPTPVPRLPHDGDHVDPAGAGDGAPAGQDPSRGATSSRRPASRTSARRGRAGHEPGDARGKPHRRGRR
jgi:ribosome-binding factor A